MIDDKQLDEWEAATKLATMRLTYPSLHRFRDDDTLFADIARAAMPLLIAEVRRLRAIVAADDGGRAGRAGEKTNGPYSV